MEITRQAVVLLDLIESLKSKGSWCGETHVQKSTFFLQAMTGVDIGFEFTLYKYGPYSFDLNSTLASLQAATLLKLESTPPYGSMLSPAPEWAHLKSQYPKTLAQFSGRIKFITDWLASKNVASLERLSTALFVKIESPEATTVEERAELIRKLKQHVQPEEATQAVQEVDAKMLEYLLLAA
jgi:uncharacterized protein YwgA